MVLDSVHFCTLYNYARYTNRNDLGSGNDYQRITCQGFALLFVFLALNLEIASKINEEIQDALDPMELESFARQIASGMVSL